MSLALAMGLASGQKNAVLRRAPIAAATQFIGDLEGAGFWDWRSFSRSSLTARR